MEAVSAPSGPGGAPDPVGRWRAPLLWRFMLQVARGLVFPVCRLRVDGDLPASLRDGPVIVAVNHIGPFDPAAVCAAFGTRHLAPAIAAFLADHPEVHFDVSLSERIVDLVEEGFDLGIRIGSTGSDNLVVPRVFAADEDVVHIPGLGHVGLLFSPTVFRAVAERLRRPAGTRATVS